MTPVLVGVVQQVGDVAVLVAAVIGVTSVVVHSRRPWRASVAGRHVMAYMGTVAAILVLSSARIAFGATLDTPWFAVLRVLVFLPMPVVMGQRLWIQLQAARDDAQERRRART